MGPNEVKLRRWPGPGYGARTRIEELLTVEDEGLLFVAVCLPNLSTVYDRFDYAVRLSEAAEVSLSARVAGRI
jgi:hypothetical protein